MNIFKRLFSRDKAMPEKPMVVPTPKPEIGENVIPVMPTKATKAKRLKRRRLRKAQRITRKNKK